MKKWKILDSLGETIGYISTTSKDKEVIRQQAWQMFPFDKPTIKEIQ